MASSQGTFDLGRPKKRVTFGLILLAMIMPWFALYLDGSSWPTIAVNFAAWLFFPVVGTLGAIIHAIICLCRTDKHRKYSKPARRRLRYDNHYSANAQAPTEEKTVQPEPEPAPVTRAVTEPPLAPVVRASTEGPTPVERAPTEPPVKKASATSSSTSVSSSDVEKENASATSSSTSVSSSDVEKENAPVPAPPQRAATAPPQRTATTPPSRAATANKDDPFKDPNA